MNLRSIFMPVAILACLVYTPTDLRGDDTVVVIDKKLVKVDGVLSPNINILGAETQVTAGEPVNLEAKLDSEFPDFVKSSTYKWEVPGHKFYQVSPAKVYFGSGTKDDMIKVNLSVALSYTVGQEIVIKTIQKSIIVQVGAGIPNPDPKPPTPNPNPPIPIPTPDPEVSDDAPVAQLDLLVVKWMKSVKLSQTDMTKACAILSQNFRASAAQVNTNKFASIKDMLVSIKQTNDDTLTNAKVDAKTLDGFAVSLQHYIWTKYQSGSFRSFGEYSDAFNKISDGFNLINK